MTSYQSDKRPHDSKLIDLPVVRNQVSKWTNSSQNDHPDDHKEAIKKREFELFEDLGDFFEESCASSFFRSRTPGHIDAEHVRKYGLRNMQGDATEKDGQEEDPFQVLPHCSDNVSFNFRGVREGQD